MHVVYGSDGLSPGSRRSAVTIGAYDGVHLGHRHVISMLGSMAAQRGLETVVVTFDRHPATVVRPDSAPPLLTDLEQKLELLAESDVDTAVVIAFDEERANESAEDFVTSVLVQGLGAQLVVVGSDFHFGHGRKGNVALLEDMGSRLGFETVGVALDDEGTGEVVSSTRIRRLVAEGDVRAAASLLGRYHQVRGIVGHGDGRGATELGFPTANVTVPPAIALPAEGVYACFYERPDGSRYRAAVSLGRRPTFHRDQQVPLLEAHLAGFAGDLYGEEAKVAFVERLRDEVRFDSVDALVEQMARDVRDSIALLGAEPAV